MDGGSLADVITVTRMAVGHMATVCREVWDPACAWDGLDGLFLESTAKGEIPCSELSFWVALMLQRRRSICTELPSGVPALTVVCSLLLSTVVELPVSFSFSFSLLPCASPSLCPEPFCIASFACKHKVIGVRVLN